MAESNGAVTGILGFCYMKLIVIKEKFYSLPFYDLGGYLVG